MYTHLIHTMYMHLLSYVNPWFYFVQDLGSLTYRSRSEEFSNLEPMVDDRGVPALKFLGDIISSNDSHSWLYGLACWYSKEMWHIQVIGSCQLTRSWSLNFGMSKKRVAPIWFWDGLHDPTVLLAPKMFGQSIETFFHYKKIPTMYLSAWILLAGEELLYDVILYLI